MAADANDNPELDALRTYYDTHDTSADMEHGEWVEPDPLDTTATEQNTSPPPTVP